MHSVDDILTNTQKPSLIPVEVINQPTPAQSVEESDDSPQHSPQAAQEETHEYGEGEKEQELTYLEKFQQDKKEFLGQKDKIDDDSAEKLQNKSEKLENKEDVNGKSESVDDTDEYGNKIQKKQKLYTEEEVNQRIRERLSRGRYAQENNQVTQQQVQQVQQQAAQDFQADPNSDVSWEKQLADFVDNRLEQKSKEYSERQWKAQEQQAQAQFEEKFNAGFSKYSDFRDVVENQPITNSMLMATRSMNDPAAFIYAAAKQQPKELQRIASIPDPYQQAAEMGRLEERMRKARTVSRAPKPSTKVKSDVNSSYNENPSVDNRILSDAKRKLGRAR
jgi:hypothetical protein